jgi:peptidyl-dipeptidase Dcp
LATLFTKFTQNVLAEENSYTLVFEKESDLTGLPPSIKFAAAAAAEERGHKGKWAIFNSRSSVEPFLSYAQRRDLREKVWRTFISRGDHADARDNNQLITEILQLRAERARLLGYKTHAHWRVEDSMANTPERAMKLMMAVWPAAVAQVKKDVADMQALADKEKNPITIEPWDYRYYSEKVRKAKYDIDASEIRPYLQLEKLRQGMFWVAGKLFDLHFSPVKNVPVYHPDVRVWQVNNGSKKLIGLLYFDLWARPNKKSGAWSNAYRSQERFEKDIVPIASVNANFVQGKPVLLSWDDAETLFHEFGHALHDLCSKVTYPSLSGTNVVRDFVELPSQILENWFSTLEVLNKFAVHYQTGKPIPKKLVEKIKRSSKFNQGFVTVEYLASALMDMKAHLAGDKPIVPAAFERKTLADLGMPHEIVMRHRLPQFNHLFADDGYSAGYYSYLWSDMLSADAYAAFTEAQGPFDQTLAKKLYDHIFSVGNTIDPADTYRAFRGRDASINALMRKRGLPEPTAPVHGPVRSKSL